MHLYHPLYGQNYTILKVKTVNSSRIYSIQTDNGVLSVHESWTDKKQQKINVRCRFDALTLKELADLLKHINNL